MAGLPSNRIFRSKAVGFSVVSLLIGLALGSMVVSLSVVAYQPVIRYVQQEYRRLVCRRDMLFVAQRLLQDIKQARHVKTFDKAHLTSQNPAYLLPKGNEFVHAASTEIAHSTLSLPIKIKKKSLKEGTDVLKLYFVPSLYQDPSWHHKKELISVKVSKETHETVYLNTVAYYVAKKGETKTYSLFRDPLGTGVKAPKAEELIAEIEGFRCFFGDGQGQYFTSGQVPHWDRIQSVKVILHCHKEQLVFEGYCRHAP